MEKDSAEVLKLQRSTEVQHFQSQPMVKTRFTEKDTLSSFNNISASLCHPSYNSFTQPFTQRRTELSGLSPGTISVLWNLPTFGKFWLSAKLARGSGGASELEVVFAEMTLSKITHAQSE